MDRSRVRRWLRGLNPLVVAVTALALVAGTLTAVYMPGGSHQGAGILAPGSSGSARHYPWWDPRGWFGGDGAPSSHTLPGTDAAIAYPPRQVRQAKAAPERRVREVTAKRTEFSRTYLLSDGKVQAVVSAGPVNYQAGPGKWAPISTAVKLSARPGYAFENVTNTFGSFFGTTAGQLVRFDAPGGGWVSIGLAAGTVRGPRVAGDTVTYPDVAPGISLSYEVTPQSLKERIMLASAAAAASLPSLPFVIKAGGGLKASRERDGSIALMRGGVPVLVLPKPFMTDARRQASSALGFAWSPKVTQHATVDAAGSTVRLSVSADSGWLGQAARKFPVTVDPTIAIAPGPADAQNTMIYSAPGYTSTNFSGSWGLSVGTDSSGVARSLLSFPLGAVPAGTQLQSADLRLYDNEPFESGTPSQTVEAHQATAAWTEATATWANTNTDVGQLGADQITIDDTDSTHTSASGTCRRRLIRTRPAGSTSITRTPPRGTRSPGYRR